MSNQAQTLGTPTAEVAEEKTASYLKKNADCAWQVFVRAHSLQVYYDGSGDGGSWMLTATVIKRISGGFQVTLYKDFMVTHDGKVHGQSGWGIGAFKNLNDARRIASALTKADYVSYPAL